MSKKNMLLMCLATAAVVYLMTTLFYFTPFGMFVYSRVAVLLGHEDSSKLFKIESIIDNKFYGEYHKTYMTDRALAAYTQATGDKYTTYLNSTTYQSMKDDMAGEFHGIGVVVVGKEKGIYITEVHVGSPASEAGILSGDYILAINGKPYSSQEVSEAVAAIKSTKSGESVVLTIERDGQSMDISVAPDSVDMEYVTEKMVDSEIGYIRVKKFGNTTAKEFEDAINSLKNQGMKSLVIDLRSNPGGSLDTVVKMVDLLVGEGIVTTIKYKDEKNTEEYRSDEKELNVPMCVLINEGSASASEIMAACLKDYDKATLVGQKTYGKGVVQGIYNLGDGTALRLTIAKYYTPSGVCIDGTGIEPDIEVDLPEGKSVGNFDTDFENDTQFEKALEVLRKDN